MITQIEKTGTNVMMMKENELEQRKKDVSSHREARGGREDRMQQRVQKKDKNKVTEHMLLGAQQNVLT